ncbi:hypothetical protein CMO83_04995 [Candidatus Woesearchaeota archaeon]|nr:hypothetical protein [Candidatus Woesearchaeota archaeon]
MFKTNKLIEYSCQDDGTFMNVKIDCEEEYGENYGCVKGACVEIEDSCTDTDEEDDPLTYGECMGKNGKIKEDKCGRFLGALRTKKLIQYSCNQNENCRKTEIDCKEDYGPGFICSRGECVES